MSHYIEKHNAIVKTWFKPKHQNAKHGDEIPHTETVSSVEIYQRNIINDQEIYTRIVLSKEMICDLHEKILQIEENIVIRPYDELPF